MVQNAIRFVRLLNYLVKLSVLWKGDEIGREYQCVCLVIPGIYVTGGANAGLFAVRARGRFKHLVTLTLPIDLIPTYKTAL